MLAQTNDYVYSPTASHQHGGYEHHPQSQHSQQHHQVHGMTHHHSGERPKIFALDTHLPAGMHALVHHTNGALHDYQHIVHGTPQHHHQHHDMTPQHQAQQHHGHHHQSASDFDHEPLMMNMHNSAAHYYPPMSAQMLHVSADYPPQPPSVANSTPSASSGTKRSREDLNMKEKKRMFKLNDRINQLKDMLDEAGVACKKNKQSILDNTSHYISMLRSNLLIAQQKAERAEKQAEVFRSQAQKQHAQSSSSNNVDDVFKRCFDQSSTARLVTDLALQPLTYNHAFLTHTAVSMQDVHKKDVLRQYLCLDTAKLDRIVETALDSLKATTSVVQARSARGDATTLTLMASVITDDFGKAVSLEFSLIPFEIAASKEQLPSPQPSSSSSYNSVNLKRETKESSPSGVSDLAL